MGTVVRKTLKVILSGYDITSEDSIPVDLMGRQEWQDAVETIVHQLRIKLRSPAFGLSDREISVHYHKTFDEFFNLIEEKIGTRQL